VDSRPLSSFQPRDFVLFDIGPEPSPKLRLGSTVLPFEVCCHTRNEIQTVQPHRGSHRQVLFTRSAFVSPRDDQSVFDAALRDQDQFAVEEIIFSPREYSRHRSYSLFTLNPVDDDAVERLWSPVSL
jgi:hypothetical protein